MRGAGPAQPRRQPSGAISFPNSGAPAAQDAFLRGVAWLHSFGYEEAIDAFRAAQKADPAFAMAYWGEALAFNQPLWFHEEPEKGRAALRKLGATPAERLAKAKTPREQAYLAAVEALWAPGTSAARDLKYAEAMAALVAKFPEDDEAQAFYALGLLGMLPRGDQSLPLRQKAGAIAEGVFARNPKHPGAAHYILHAYDHGALAAKALAAARAYAGIAPAASHALHMPAHAFMQLGYWEEAAATDQASWDASVQWAAAARRARWSCATSTASPGCTTSWTQLGRFKEAAGAVGLVDEALKSGEADRHDRRPSLHRQRDRPRQRPARRCATTGARCAPATSSRASAGRRCRGRARSTASTSCSRSASAPRSSGDAPRVEADHRASCEGLGARPARGAARAGGDHAARDAGAASSSPRGGIPDAFVEMDRATALQGRMPKPIGRPFPVKGADELYGELLLEAGRPQAAVEWFDRTLAADAESQPRGARPGPRAREGRRRRRQPPGLRAVPAELAERGPRPAGAEEARTALGR